MRGRIPRLVCVCAVVIVASTVIAARPQPQDTSADTGALPFVVVQLQRGHPFNDDVRRLPNGLPKQHEDHRKKGDDEEPRLRPGNFDDPAAQIEPGAAPVPGPGSGGGAGNFSGLNYTNHGSGWPPDTNGDVGPTYYLQTVNSSVGIFRKSDGALVGAFSFDALMSQGHFGNLCDTDNFGDPVVVWDSSADRWIVTDFAFALDSQNDPVAPFYQCFAVSRTGDPLSGGWYFYSLQTTDVFPDYPKLGVWPDALYLTANTFNGNTFVNVRTWALNKTQMYAGVAPTAVVFNLPSKIQGVSVFTGIPSTYHNVTGAPPAGRPNFISVIWSAKVARIWKFHVDWNNTANSTLTGPSSVTLASWGTAPATVPAKNGNALDTLRERAMMQAQYVNQSGVESLYLTHTVANPGNSSLASPRWYQINVSGGNVVTSGPLQQSTWAPDSTVARWMPSLAVDKDGNMAIGYSASSSSLFPAVRYAGRLASDPPNTLGQSETSLVEGTASQCCNFSNGDINNRWGDYSAMTIDPDGCTFWYTNEYYQSPQPATLAQDNWQTRIGSFKYDSCIPNSATLTGSVTASATGNPINAATVSAGTQTTTTNSSGQYTIGSLAPGTYTVTASATGYASASASVTLSASATTTQNFALVASGPAPTSLVVATASGTYGGTTTLSATLSASGSGVASKTINFTLNGTSAGSAVTNASGIATVSNVSLSGIAAGSYPSGVGATFAGDASYASSSGTNSLTIAKANQTITFNPLPDKTTSDPPFTVTATASSGLPVSFAATGNCTVSGNTVTITGAGSCTITASQAGNGNYNAAPNVPRTFTITSGGGGGGGTSAAFIRSDTTTQGSWQGVYGSRGYGIVNDSFNFPSYAQVTVNSAGTWVWASSTSDVRALQKAGGPDRIASCWYTNPTVLTVDINLTDGLSHQVAIYGVNWDGGSRSQTLDVLDAATSAVLDSRTMTAFIQGQYLVWSVSGHVVLRVTNTGSPNAVISGIFLDGGSGAAPTSLAVAPASGTFGGTTTLSATLSASGSGVSSKTINFTLNGTPAGNAVTNGAGVATLSNVSLSGIAAGTYPSGVGATFAGDASYASSSGTNSLTVTSGGGGGGTSAAFIRSDTTTQGSWQGVYGSRGYGIVNDSFNFPSYAQLTVNSAATWVWASSTSDVRALQKAGGPDRIASCWYTNPTVFTVDINLTDGLSHQVALYGVNWDAGSRSQTIDVLDAATNAVLDSRTMTSFIQGQYLVWSVSGHVVLRVTNTGSPNAVISGVFVD
jgi:hypothetical protein